MSRPVTIIKVDPERRRIVRMSIKPSVAGVRQVIGTANIGHRMLLDDVNGEILFVGARVDQDPDKPRKEWRLRGGENTVGVGILFGSYQRNAAGPGMWHVPVDAAWVERHIVWCEPGETAPAAEVRERLALPAPGGEGDGQDQ